VDDNSLEAAQRYRGLTALIKAVIADEITVKSLVNPGLALLADFAVNGMLQLTAGQEPLQ
jgi:hypothetical protein